MLALLLMLMLIGDALFQIPINLRYGWRAFDRREGRSWSLGRLSIPKFYGYLRLVEIALGLLLLFHQQAIDFATTH